MNIKRGRRALFMRTAAKKNIRHTSLAEILSSLTKSLAFQVQMIMWEDKQYARTGDQGMMPGRNTDR